MKRDAALVRWGALISLLSVTVLWCARWPSFPVFLDPYYHALVAQQIVDAGGPITYEWWQSAPAGRPHLYPPVLHVVLAGLLKAGCPPLVVLRLITACLVPLLLLSVYLVMRRLFTASTALCALWMALVPFAWVIHIGGTLASGVALVELLWLLVALAEQRVVAATCLLGLLMYTHLGIPWIAVATFVWGGLLGVWGRSRARLLSVCGGILLGAPWLFHLARHLSAFHVTRRIENEAMELFPALWLLAAWGAWRCWTRGGTARLLLALLLGFGLMAYPFTFRWLTGEGTLPVALLAGVGLEQIALWGAARWEVPGRAWGWRALLVGLAVLSPSVVWEVRQPLRVAWVDSTPFHLMGWPTATEKGKDVHLATAKTEQLADVVARVSQPGEILWSNMAYAGGLVALLAHRATSSVMLSEVAPAEPFDPIGAAQWIVWWKVEPRPDLPGLAEVVQRYALKEVADTDLARIFHNPAASERARAPTAVVPFGASLVLLCGLVWLAAWDLQTRKSLSNP
ncbi:MAG: hypothetical protein Q8R91_01305 [Candidatus Omnitrophota bacterium]|nr:hypothetical protein [Candidatus Omnitrophota bacterium]